MIPQRFNLRVYGIMVHEGKVLLTHEKRSGMYMLKFPGGGLEKGEGIEDCLKREFQEELKIEIEVDEIFYVNDFLQISAFNPKDQLISFYYKVSSSMIDQIDERSELEDLSDDDQIFEWVELEDVQSKEFTFPIDRIVADKIMLSVS
jgi:8-oxo-dGTP diphosphatase